MPFIYFHFASADTRLAPPSGPAGSAARWDSIEHIPRWDVAAPGEETTHHLSGLMPSACEDPVNSY